MNNIDKLLIEMFQFKNKKTEAINYQRYEEAASARDSEKELGREIYEIITGNDNYRWDELERVISEYCQNNYGFSYRDADSLKQLKRQVKLKDLGI